MERNAPAASEALPQFHPSGPETSQDSRWRAGAIEFTDHQTGAESNPGSESLALSPVLPVLQSASECWLQMFWVKKLLVWLESFWHLTLATMMEPRAKMVSV